MLLSRKLIDSIGHIADICHYLTVPTDPNTAIFGKGFLKRYCQPPPATALGDCLLGKLTRFDSTINFDIGSIILEVTR